MSIRGLQQGDNLDNILRRSIRSRQKRKAQDLIGGLLAAPGFLMFGYGMQANPIVGLSGLAMMLLGGFLIIWARIMNWWEREEFYDER